MVWKRASLLTRGGSAWPSRKASVEFEENIPGMLNTPLGSPPPTALSQVACLGDWGSASSLLLVPMLERQGSEPSVNPRACRPTWDVALWSA